MTAPRFPKIDSLTAAQIADVDRAHIWHPYAAGPVDTGPVDTGPIASGPVASGPVASGPLVVHRAQGCRLDITTRSGERVEVIDAMSSWWAAIHGYNHPTLNEAVTEQLGRMSHVMFGGLTHAPAAALAHRLIDITPDQLDRVFFCDSGSVAVEVAQKMALQYWQSVGQASRQRFLTWRGGYHGDTFHPMSVCDPDGGMHRMWSGVLPHQIFADAPPCGFDRNVEADYLAAFEALLDRHSNEIAAIIVEPVVQGAGRMNFHNPGYVAGLRELADRYDTLLIFDEIATGFGRTGALFAADHAGVVPDIMCVGKALTGGYMTMAATMCTARVANGISSGAMPVLAHGPTFMANPLAAATACASIDLLLSQDWSAAVSRCERVFRTELGRAEHLPGVRDVRSLGAIGVIEMESDVDVALATSTALEHGVWIRPFRNLIYAMPPYVCSEDELTTIARAMVEAADRR